MECLKCKTNFEPIIKAQLFCKVECRKEYRKADKALKDKEYHLKHKESKKEYDKKRYSEKADEYRLRAKIHKQKNKHLRWAKEKEILEANFDKKCYKNILTLIKNYFRKGIEETKNSKTFERLGYSLPELKKRLLETMPDGFNWNDYINSDLHLDHIIPHSKFKYDSYEHENFKKAWSLKNLRLLPKSINISQNNR